MLRQMLLYSTFRLLYLFIYHPSAYDHSFMDRVNGNSLLYLRYRLHYFQLRVEVGHHLFALLFSGCAYGE